MFAIAQMVAGGWGIGQIIIAVIVVLAAIGIALIACKQFGIAIPQWFIQILIIVLVACVAIVAIRFLLSM
jgi:hypothetical protein